MSRATSTGCALLLGAAVAVCCAGRGDQAPAAENHVVYRSLRAEGHDRLDELDLPRAAQRACHWGWEFRSRHFVVFSTVSAEQALWTADRLEEAWSDIGRLADQWTSVHRQPNFGIGAVDVTITGKPVHPQAQPVPGPDKMNYAAEIFVDLSKGPVSLPHRLPQLRREAFLAFLRVAQQDQVLPDWVQVGLAEYFSGEEPPLAKVETLLPPKPAAGDPTGVWARRVVADRMTPLVENRQGATLWVRYLLEGDDAEHAPDFFSAMAATLAGQARDPFRPSPGVGAVVRFASAPGPANPLPFKDLIRNASQGEQVSHWLQDRDAGQPIVRPAPEDLALGQREREMVLILKLARRFPGPPWQPIRPRIVESGIDRTEKLTVADDPRPLDLAALYRRLSDPGRPAWATLDTDGSLLLSSDRDRLAELLAGADRRYRVAFRQGHSILETHLPTGQVIEAWLEENAENPQRPIAHLKAQAQRGGRP